MKKNEIMKQADIIKNKKAKKSAFLLGIIGGTVSAVFGVFFIIAAILGPSRLDFNENLLYTIFTLSFIILCAASLAGAFICRNRRVLGGWIMLGTAVALLVLMIWALIRSEMAITALFSDTTVRTLCIVVWIAGLFLSIASAVICLKADKVVIYIVCIFLTFLSIMPFFIMIINSTRSTAEIQQHAISFLPSGNLIKNYEVFGDKSFNPWTGFFNSFIISTSATILTIYFSTLTAYGLFAYRWKMRQPFFTTIMAVMMIPAQITGIGFYQFMYRIGMKDNMLALILPAIAAPMVVFFMRQYMISSLNLDIMASARIDGAGEFRIFNGIVLPIMKPAMATQAIFTFVFNWNNFFLPIIILTKQELYTMPIMVSLLKGDIYKTEYGTVYLALTLSVLPLFIIYFALSRYIVAGVALGSVKE